MKKQFTKLAIGLSPKGIAQLQEQLEKSMHQAGIKVAEKLSDKIIDNIKQLTEGRIEPVSRTDKKKLEVVITTNNPDAVKIENETHAFEYTVDDIPKMLKQIK